VGQTTFIRLVRPPINADVIEALEHLLDEARAGRIIGLAYVSYHGGRDHNVGAAGVAREVPELSIGFLRELEDRFAELIGPGKHSS
jgi:hypothetical protein